MEKNLKESLKEIGMENDTISLMVDVSSLEEVKYYYSVFGWKISSEKRDAIFHRTYHIVFERDHFIDNKEELQLLEVEFESNVKKLNKAKVKKHRWTKIFALSFSLLFFVCLVLGLCFYFGYPEGIPLYASILLLSFSGLFFILCPCFCIPTFKMENKKFNTEFKSLVKERKRIIEDTRKVRP